MLTPPENKLDVPERPIRDGACEWCLSPGPHPLRRAVVFGRVFDICSECIESLKTQAVDTKGI